MFQYLKRRLGIQDLEMQMQSYRSSLRNMEQGVAMMSNQLLDLHITDGTTFQRHGNIMEHLEMILKALENARSQKTEARPLSRKEKLDK